jgi:hypothetical protein
MTNCVRILLTQLNTDCTAGAQLHVSSLIAVPFIYSMAPRVSVVYIAATLCYCRLLLLLVAKREDTNQEKPGLSCEAGDRLE